jgi:carbon storage regulator
MLVLTRKLGEVVLIGDKIRLTVVSIKGNQVQLGFTAPPQTRIWRMELLARDHSSGQEPRTACSPANVAGLNRSASSSS